MLVQQNLVYHHTDADTTITSYEANPDGCYNLVRSGKILDVIESRYGPAERELVQTLMLLGHARVADLAQAFSARGPKVNGHVNGSESERITSQSQFHHTLARLVQAEIVEPMRPESFRKPADVYQEIKEDVTKTLPGEKSTKKKDQQLEEMQERYRVYRDQPKMLKRKLDQEHGPAGKRRKLANGHGTHRTSTDDHDDLEVNVRILGASLHHTSMVL